MIGTVLVVVAGWLRHKLAALVIVVASIAVQIFFVLPQVAENRRLLGLPQADLSITITLITIEMLVAGTFFYFVGSGLRWLRDRTKKARKGRSDPTSERAQ